jgi:hypothetical protein
METRRVIRWSRVLEGTQAREPRDSLTGGRAKRLRARQSPGPAADADLAIGLDDPVLQCDLNALSRLAWLSAQ